MTFGSRWPHSTCWLCDVELESMSRLLRPDRTRPITVMMHFSHKRYLLTIYKSVLIKVEARSRSSNVFTDVSMYVPGLTICKSVLGTHGTCSHALQAFVLHHCIVVHGNMTALPTLARTIRKCWLLRLVNKLDLVSLN